MDDVDLLKEALVELRASIDEATRKLAQHVKQHGDDPVAYQLADVILVALANERRYRRMLVAEVAG